MSSQLPIEVIVALISAQEQNKLHCFAGSALLCYDWLLTLDREVHYVWPRVLSSSSLLYLLIRYLSLGVTILTILNLSPFPGKTGDSCSVLGHFSIIIGTIMIIMTIIFAGLRAYALWPRVFWAAIAVVLLGVVNPVSTLYLGIEGGGWTNLTSYGCNVPPKIPISSYPSFDIAMRTCAMAADAIVVALTWLRVWPMRRESEKFGQASPLLSVLFVNGILYFIVLFITNLVGLALIKEMDLIYVTVQWNSVLTTILTCRFILDLQEAAGPTEGTLITSGTLPLFAPDRTGKTEMSSVYGAVTWTLWTDSHDEEVGIHPYIDPGVASNIKGDDAPQT